RCIDDLIGLRTLAKGRRYGNLEQRSAAALHHHRRDRAIVRGGGKRTRGPRRAPRLRHRGQSERQKGARAKGDEDGNEAEEATHFGMHREGSPLRPVTTIWMRRPR